MPSPQKESISARCSALSREVVMHHSAVVIEMMLSLNCNYFTWHSDLVLESPPFPTLYVWWWILLPLDSADILLHLSLCHLVRWGQWKQMLVPFSPKDRCIFFRSMHQLLTHFSRQPFDLFQNSSTFDQGRLEVGYFHEYVKHFWVSICSSEHTESLCSA